MEYLWTPWRSAYMEAPKDPGRCIFCEAARDPAADEANLVIFRAQHCFVILNRFPYTSGHLMVVPYEHVAKLSSISRDTAIELMDLARRTEEILERSYRPDGFNIGMNVGAAAGAGIAGHAHLHMLPRWSGDANFMTTVAQVRIIPEALEDTYRKLSRAFAQSA